MGPVWRKTRGALLAATATVCLSSGAVLVAARVLTGFWCPRCGVERITADLRAINADLRAINDAPGPTQAAPKPAGIQDDRTCPAPE